MEPSGAIREAKRRKGTRNRARTGAGGKTCTVDRMEIEENDERRRKNGGWRREAVEEHERRRIHERESSKRAKKGRKREENAVLLEKERKRGRGRAIVCGWKTLETVFIVAKVMSHAGVLIT